MSLYFMRNQIYYLVYFT